MRRALRRWWTFSSALASAWPYPTNHRHAYHMSTRLVTKTLCQQALTVTRATHTIHISIGSLIISGAPLLTFLSENYVWFVKFMPWSNVIHAWERIVRHERNWLHHVRGDAWSDVRVQLRTTDMSELAYTAASCPSGQYSKLPVAASAVVINALTCIGSCWNQFSVWLPFSLSLSTYLQA